VPLPAVTVCVAIRAIYPRSDIDRFDILGLHVNPAFTVDRSWDVAALDDSLALYDYGCPLDVSIGRT
jgi:hypothetical protein